MNFDIALTGFVALYIFMLAAFAGWVIIGNVPAILHTPLMSGSNFVHGIVVVGGLYALFNASTPLDQAIGFFAVPLGSITSRRAETPPCSPWSLKSSSAAPIYARPSCSCSA
jgi:NAD(P) transhydrogenase subunit alpha